MNRVHKNENLREEGWPSRRGKFRRTWKGNLQASKEASINRPTSNKPARILLIEDDASFVYLIGRALDDESFHYALTTLDDGAQALAFIRRQAENARSPRPDLIVMDLHLPKSDG
ncbi:MAG: response regulator, partial [Bryobacteraceae bacterium]